MEHVLINFVYIDIICQDFYVASDLFHSIFNPFLLYMPLALLINFKLFHYFANDIAIICVLKMP